MKIKAFDGNIEEVEESMENVSVDDIYYGDEVLFYIPKKDEKLHWQPMAQGREGWEDGGKRRSQKVEQQDCFLGVERARGDDDGGGDGGNGDGTEIGGEQRCSWKDFVLGKKGKHEGERQK